MIFIQHPIVNYKTVTYQVIIDHIHALLGFNPLIFQFSYRMTIKYYIFLSTITINLTFFFLNTVFLIHTEKNVRKF